MNESQKALRREMLAALEAQLKQSRPNSEDSLFARHKSEDRIVVSHTLFWVMSRQLSARLGNVKAFLLLRQYQEEMLEAYITESDYFSDLLHYCNIIFDILPFVLTVSEEEGTNKLLIRRVRAITLVACGFGGDMPDNLADTILDDIDFNAYGKISCKVVEELKPQLAKFVTEEEEWLKGI